MKEMAKFYESFHCNCGLHCNRCRELSETGKFWREQIVLQYAPGLKDSEFSCPREYPWRKQDAEKIVVEKRKTPEIKSKNRGIVEISKEPCMYKGEDLGLLPKTCCGGRVKQVKHFKCLKDDQPRPENECRRCMWYETQGKGDMNVIK